MERIKLETSYADERGIIVDLVVGSLSSVTLVTFKKGAVRGNHFHKHTSQWNYVLEGSLEGWSFSGGVKKFEVFTKGDLFLSPPLVPHAIRALENSHIMVITAGPRAGSYGYEGDTFRYELI